MPNESTGRPRYMRSFYLRIHVYEIEMIFIYRTYPLIYSHPWSFYMRIHYMRVIFYGPYLSHITRSACTVKPVCNDYPWGPIKVPVVERWSLFRGHLCDKSSNSDLKMMAVIDRWSLAQV
jgi:hypothetical protein